MSTPDTTGSWGRETNIGRRRKAACRQGKTSVPVSGKGKEYRNGSCKRASQALRLGALGIRQEKSLTLDRALRRLYPGRERLDFCQMKRRNLFK